MYNTNDSAPSWAINVVPSANNFRRASKFQISATDATVQVADFSAANNCMNYVTIRGFRLIAQGGQAINASFVGNLVIQYNEANSLSNPGGMIFVGPVHGPSSCSADHVQILNNYFHDNYGETIYVGSISTTGNPTDPAQNANSGDDYLIQGNEIVNAGIIGGEGDAIDVKEGHTNLRIIGNNIRGAKNTSMTIESASVIAGNYSEAPAKLHAYITTGWSNAVGRQSLAAYNNVFVNSTICASSNCQGFWIDGAANGSATYQWQDVKLYNNVIFAAGAACIMAGAPTGSVDVRNNILQACGAGGIVTGRGITVTHDYNDFYSITGNAIDIGGSTSTCGGITGAEPNSKCANPLFVSTSPPYTAANFALQAGSPAKGSGVDLSLTFRHDYTGSPRAVPWDQGAISNLSGFATNIDAPTPPTGLVVR
jgi:hypothetical protein